ncbi:MAG: PrsW family intramembrane metalloprotease [Halodesulfurarchaeum sp.]
MSGRDRQDPIQWAADAGTDLYDIATWEPRTRLDGFAMSVYRSILAGGRALVIGLAILIVLSQFLFTGMAAIRDPLVGVYILLSIVPALLLAVFLWRSDVLVREPLEQLVITFLLGFVLAGFAAVFNSAFKGFFLPFGAIGSLLFFFIIVGPIEESVKLLAVRLHAYRSAPFDAVIDGAVYGAMAGLGFAAIENTIYIAGQYLAVSQVGGTVGVPTVTTAAVRTFAGPGHVIYSAFAGYYLGLAKFNPEHRGPIIAKGLIVAVFIHATYNTLVSHLDFVLGFVPILASLPQMFAFIGFVIAYDGFFLLVLYTKLRRYRRVFDEVGASSFYEESERTTEAHSSVFDR